MDLHGGGVGEVRQAGVVADVRVGGPSDEELRGDEGGRLLDFHAHAAPARGREWGRERGRKTQEE